MELDTFLYAHMKQQCTFFKWSIKEFNHIGEKEKNHTKLLNEIYKVMHMI